RRFCRSAKRLNGMARAAVRANDSFVLGFFEDVHNGAKACCPIAFGEAVHQQNVDIFGAEFAAETVEIGTHFVWIASPGFREHGNFAAVDVLECFGDVWMAAVRIGGIEEAEAAVVPIEKEFGEAADTEVGLMRVMANPNRASAHGKARGLNAGLAEGY